VIPTKPSYVPSAAAAAQAEDLLRRSLPRADDVSTRVTADVRFVDCGSNFETVTCPYCATDVGEWWALAMDVAHEQRFVDLRATTPCCGRWVDLNELVYSLSMGFARFVLEAMNPDVFELPDTVRLEVERILGCRVRLIWAHV
jgi:hypothetical protein